MLDISASLMVVLASMLVKPTTVTVNNPGARPLMAPSATDCHSARDLKIRSMIARPTVMSGRWPRSNKTTSRKAQLETAYDACRAGKIPVHSPVISQAVRKLTLRLFEGGGAQLQAFLAGKNQKGPRKTCDGDVRDGDYWTIDFNLDNTPIE